MPRYYIEHDGRVLTRKDDQGEITLPEEVQIPFEEATRQTLRGVQVVFGNAKLEEHPREWACKDDLAHASDASPLLRAAINASLFRPVVGVVVESDGEILLVKPARGVATGRWTLPGGFVNFFESPRDAARREVKEEAGIEIRDLALLTTVTYTHSSSPYPILGLGYTARPADGSVDVDEDEIADATWMAPQKAADGAGGIGRAVLDELLEEPR